MTLKIESNKAELKFPQLSVFMGSPKVGKSTMMAKLPKALIFDLEGTGYSGIDADAIVRPENYEEVEKGTKMFFGKTGSKYTTLVIDHLRMLTTFITEDVSDKRNVDFVADADYGIGYAETSHRVKRFLNLLIALLSKYPEKRVILVAHSIDKNGETRLDVDGKNESVILSMVDAIGYISREDKNISVNFKGRRGHEFGTRNRYLSNYKGKFNWKTLFDVAKGKLDETDTD